MPTAFHPKIIFRQEYVQSLTTNADGHELGPEAFVCDDNDDCGDYPCSEACP